MQRRLFDEAAAHMQSIAMKSTSWTNRLMVAEGLRRGIEVSKVPGRDRLTFTHENRHYTWSGGLTSFNSPLARKLVIYKDATSRLLLDHGVGAIENAVFAPDDEERAWDWAHPFEKIVLKPQNGIQGEDVYAGLKTREEFHEAYSAISKKRNHILVGEHHPGIEHRFTVVRNRVVAVTRRRPASVIGDGTSSVAELVDRKNTNRGEIHKPLCLGRPESEALQKQGLAFKSVPHEGERIYLRPTSNIHTGGDAVDATDVVAPAHKDLAEAASRAIPGLRVTGIDILIPTPDQTRGAALIEINAGAMISMHHFPWEGQARDVAGTIMDAMFPKTAELRT